MRQREQLTVSEAKERLVRSIEDIDPFKKVREKPIKSLGAFGAAGVLVGFTMSAYMRRAMAYSRLAWALLGKFV